MTSGRTVLLLVLPLSLVAALAAAAEFDPYEIPRAQFAAQVRTIALRPLHLPADSVNPEAVRAAFETLLTDALRAKGYAVVPAAVYASLWRQMSERLGGTYDAISGEPRKDPFEAARDHTGRELTRLHAADAILDPFISIDWAPFGSGWFAYESFGERLLWQGAPIVDSLQNRPQQVRGAYLNVVITDVAGGKLYGIRSGIEWTTVYAARGYEEKSPERLYRDVERDRHAVELDLEPLIPAHARE